MTQFGFQQRFSGATGGARRVPEGYAPVVVQRSFMDSVLRVCVLVRKQPEPVAGHLVSLRETLDARVFLGALCDASGAVREWLEVWVQTVDGVKESAGAAMGTLSNAALDERWARMCDAWTGGGPGGSEPPIRTGLETGERRLTPVWLDVQRLEPVHATGADEGAAPWELCVDDGTLAAAGLPAYSSSLLRYISNGHFFAPVTRGAPANERCRTLAEVAPRAAVPLAPEGGRLMVRRLAPMAFDSYVGFLGDPKTGHVSFGTAHGRGVVELADAGEHEPGSPAGAFLLDGHGARSRLIELLFLKLRLLADAVGAVRAHVAATGRPLLNLRPESFRVRLSRQARGLPRLWSARAELVDPGNAVTLPIRAVEAAYFVRGRMDGGGGASIYWPEAAAGGGGGGVSGTGQLRIRQVLTQAGEETILEGTLTAHERLRAARNDLVSLRIGLGSGGGSGRVDLFGRVQSETAMAEGELRLRTLAQRLLPESIENLKAAEGVPLSGVSFEVLPVLSTPCDLYSLGVVAVRTLLVGGKDRPNTAPVALDEMLSLTRELAAGWSEGEPAWKRVGELFGADRRWFDSLGPQRLSAGESLTPEQALALVPEEVWFRVLAMVAAMFPGMGRDSTCTDLGDASGAGLHVVFDEAAGALEDLLRRTRSLIVVDWHHNREVHAVLRRFMTGVAG